MTLFISVTVTKWTNIWSSSLGNFEEGLLSFKSSSVFFIMYESYFRNENVRFYIFSDASMNTFIYASKTFAKNKIFSYQYLRMFIFAKIFRLIYSNLKKATNEIGSTKDRLVMS